MFFIRFSLVASPKKSRVVIFLSSHASLLQTQQLQHSCGGVVESIIFLIILPVQVSSIVQKNEN